METAKNFSRSLTTTCSTDWINTGMDYMYPNAIRHLWATMIHRLDKTLAHCLLASFAFIYGSNVDKLEDYWDAVSVDEVKE